MTRKMQIIIVASATSILTLSALGQDKGSKASERTSYSDKDLVGARR